MNNEQIKARCEYYNEQLMAYGDDGVYLAGNSLSTLESLCREMVAEGLEQATAGLKVSNEKLTWALKELGPTGTNAWKSCYEQEVLQTQFQLWPTIEKLKAELAEYRSIAEKAGADKAVSQLATMTAQRDRLWKALSELHAVVKGECPSLLNEDSGGDAQLDRDIEEALKE